MSMDILKVLIQTTSDHRSRGQSYYANLHFLEEPFGFDPTLVDNSVPFQSKSLSVDAIKKEGGEY